MYTRLLSDLKIMNCKIAAYDYSLRRHKFMIPRLAAFILLNIFLISACIAGPSALSRDKFITDFKAPFISIACGEKGILLQCFKIDMKQCRNKIDQVYADCKGAMYERRMPADIKTTHESRVWGSKLANCISQKIKLKNKTLFRSNNSICKGIK